MPKYTTRDSSRARPRPSARLKPPLRALFVTPEMHPLVKTGGLGDVSGALPAALVRSGVDVQVLLPGYPRVMEQVENLQPALKRLALPGFPETRLLAASCPNCAPLLVLDCPDLYRRDGEPYQNASGVDWPDNPRRFGLLCRAAALLSCDLSPLAWRPHVTHCQDWQSGLAPAFLHYAQGRHAATLMTVHNLAFQGIFAPATAAELGLPPEAFSINGVEYYGKLSFLKAGLYYADHISTVSPTYAREIQGEELGFGLHGLLSGRSARLSGILNGIDTQEWDPARDPHLAHAYSAQDLGGKADNKRELQRQMGLPERAHAPLLGVVSRITLQKGIDLLVKLAPRLTERGVQLVVLGSGESKLQQALVALQQRFPRAIAVRIGFDEKLSHLIEAGCDMFLMPSRFEPCGLNQMYSQRYGTPPMVHATGGLCDSVVDTTPDTLANDTATGFVFREMSAGSFLAAIDRALAAWRDPQIWRELQQNGMEQDFSWDKSAQQYLALYRSLAETAVR